MNLAVMKAIDFISFSYLSIWFSFFFSCVRVEKGLLELQSHKILWFGKNQQAP